MPPTQILIALLLSFSPLASFAADLHTDRKRGSKLLSLPDGSDVWHFVVYGDRTGGPAEGNKVLAQAVRETNLLNPDLVMTVGDLIQGYNTTPDWLEQMREFKQTMGELTMPWFPVAGNHDVYWRGPNRPAQGHELNYETHFGPLWYWFEHKGAGFIVLYTDEGDPQDGSKGFRRQRHVQMSEEQIAWISKTLQATQRLDHVFVFLHHPRWRTGYYGENNWNRVHELFVKAGNVRTVFAGHVHRIRYDGKIDGIDYLSLGTTGGGKPEDFPLAGWVHHFNVVTVRGDDIRHATLPVGAVVDPKDLTTEHLAEMDALLRLGSPLSLTTAVYKKDGAAAGSYEVELKNPASTPVKTTLMLDSHATGWRFSPDHHHLKLEPGERLKLAFEYQKGPGFDDFRLPELVYQVDYLGETVRVSLPERRAPLEVKLEELPETVFEARPYAGSLDGRGACYRVASDQASPPQGPFTLEGWIYPKNLNGRSPFLAKSENSEYYLFCTDALPSFGVHLGGRYVEAKSAERIPTDTWTHLAGEYDGTRVRLYVNGQLAAETEGSGERRTNGHPLYLGADPNRRGDPVNPLEGRIDEVRLSRGARYSGENFKPALHLEADETTLLLFRLDYDLGPFTPDYSSQAAHAHRVGDARVQPRTGAAPR